MPARSGADGPISLTARSQRTGAALTGPVAGLVGIEGGVVSGVINLESPALKRRPGDHAMKNVTSKPELSHSAIETNSHLFDDWFDPIEDMIRGQVRGLIEEMIRGELDATLSRPRYGRRAGHSEGRDSAAVVTGHRHGSRVRTLTGTFGKTEIAVPRARLNGSGGKTTEWKSQVLRNYQRRNPGCRRADRRCVSCRHQYAPRAACTSQRIWWGGWQGHGAECGAR